MNLSIVSISLCVSSTRLLKFDSTPWIYDRILLSREINLLSMWHLRSFFISFRVTRHSSFLTYLPLLLLPGNSIFIFAFSKSNSPMRPCLPFILLVFVFNKQKKAPPISRKRLLKNAFSYKSILLKIYHIYAANQSILSILWNFPIQFQFFSLLMNLRRQALHL